MGEVIARKYVPRGTGVHGALIEKGHVTGITGRGGQVMGDAHEGEVLFPIESCQIAEKRFLRRGVETRRRPTLGGLYVSPPNAEASWRTL